VSAKTDFETARMAAMQNPGSVMTRSPNGSFIVKDNNGTIIYGANVFDPLKANTLIKDELLVQRDEEINLLKSQLHDANSKLSRIIDSDWELIKERESEEQNSLDQKLRDERKIVYCQCEGSNENCSFCYGKGTFEIDGYGQKV